MDTKEREKYRHLLKICKEFADAKLAGLKPWEIRSEKDRMFCVGDIVVYKVIDDPDHPLNGKEHTITYVYAGEIGLIKNFCIFTDKESGATAESAATQLALQDAEDALARTREERDKLREEVAELRGKIERLRNDLAYWRGDAEGQKQLADAMEKELDEVNENWGKRKRELEQLSRANAELAASNVELREQIRELEHEKHCETLRADALAVSRDKWKASSEAMAEALAAVKERTERAERTEGTEGGSGGNAESPL